MVSLRDFPKNSAFFSVGNIMTPVEVMNCSLNLIITMTPPSPGMLQQGSVVQTLDVIRGSLCPGDSFAAHEVPLDAMMESLGHRKCMNMSCSNKMAMETIPG